MLDAGLQPVNIGAMMQNGAGTLEDIHHAGPNQQNISSLTGIRFFAAFFVLISHALPGIVPVPAAGALYTFFYALSGIGMPLFFVLSGFVIQYNYADYIRNNGGRGLYNFFVARFARLYPLFFLCLAYDLAYQWSFKSLPPETLTALPYYLTLTHSWFYKLIDGTALVLYFGLMPQVSWSISTEWFFYLLFPIVGLVLFRVRSAKALALTFLIIALAGLALTYLLVAKEQSINAFADAHFGPAISPHTMFRWLVYFAPYSRFFEFLLGCVTAEIFKHFSNRTPSAREQKLGFYVLLAAMSLLVALYFLSFPFASYVLRLTHVDLTMFHYANGFAALIAVIIFCCARYSNVVTKFLSAKYIILGGEISYSIYMLHFLIIQPFRLKAGMVTFDRLYVADFLSLAVVIAATFGLALVSYTFVEVPAKRWINRTLSVKIPVTA